LYILQINSEVFRINSEAVATAHRAGGGVRWQDSSLCAVYVV